MKITAKNYIKTFGINQYISKKVLLKNDFYNTLKILSTFSFNIN